MNQPFPFKSMSCYVLTFRDRIGFFRYYVFDCIAIGFFSFLFDRNGELGVIELPSE